MFCLIFNFGLAVACHCSPFVSFGQKTSQLIIKGHLLIRLQLIKTLALQQSSEAMGDTKNKFQLNHCLIIVSINKLQAEFRRM